jgi:hypothetical protein
MNEIEVIRRQLCTERTHAAQVAEACAAVLGSRTPVSASPDALQAFREACVAYLVWVLARFEERDQSFAERLGSFAPRAPASPRALDATAASATLSSPGSSREALSRLEAALGARSPPGSDAPQPAQPWREFARYIETAWNPRRTALDDLLTHLPGIAECRAVCAIDADSILDERARFARVTGALPEGTSLRAPPARQAR